MFEVEGVWGVQMGFRVQGDFGRCPGAFGGVRDGFWGSPPYFEDPLGLLSIQSRFLGCPGVSGVWFWLCQGGFRRAQVRFLGCPTGF